MFYKCVPQVAEDSLNLLWNIDDLPSPFRSIDSHHWHYDSLTCTRFNSVHIDYGTDSWAVMLKICIRKNRLVAVKSLAAALCLVLTTNLLLFRSYCKYLFHIFFRLNFLFQFTKVEVCSDSKNLVTRKFRLTMLYFVNNLKQKCFMLVSKSVHESRTIRFLDFTAS